jgi:hypothetical protein
VSEDLGYVEVGWDDFSPAGLDETSYGTGDVQVAGVSIDRVEILPSGRVRYWYNDDGDTLKLGQVQVIPQPGQVLDRAGNANAAAGAASFLRLQVACAWSNPLLRYDANSDTFVSPQDVLVIVNELNRRAIIDQFSRLPAPQFPSPLPPMYYDVNCDKHGTPQDVLVIVNELNRRFAGEGESNVERQGQSDHAVPAETEKTIVLGPTQFFVLPAGDTPSASATADEVQPLAADAVSLHDRMFSDLNWLSFRAQAGDDEDEWLAGLETGSDDEFSELLNAALEGLGRAAGHN